MKKAQTKKIRARCESAARIKVLFHEPLADELDLCINRGEARQRVAFPPLMTTAAALGVDI